MITLSQKNSPNKLNQQQSPPSRLSEAELNSTNSVFFSRSQPWIITLILRSVHSIDSSASYSLQNLHLRVCDFVLLYSFICFCICFCSSNDQKTRQYPFSHSIYLSLWDPNSVCLPYSSSFFFSRYYCVAYEVFDTLSQWNLTLIFIGILCSNAL